MSRVHTRQRDCVTASFVLTVEDLKRLHKALTSFGNKLTYQVTCADDATRELDFKRLCEYENPPRKAIRSITVDVRREGDIDRFAFLFIGAGFGSAFDMTVGGPESEIEKVRASVKDIAVGMRPWYWWIAKFSFLVAGLLAAVFAFGLSVIMMAIGLLSSRSHADSLSIPLLIVCATAGGVVAVALAVCERLKQKVFPAVTFAIGQGVRRHDIMEKVRWGVVVCFVVSIVATVVGGVFLLPFATGGRH